MKAAIESRMFRVKSGVTAMWFAFGVCGLAMLTVGLASSGDVGSSVALIVASIMMVLWSRRAHPVKLHPDHVELKFAPLARLQRILYRDIRRVEEISRNRVKLVWFDGRKERHTRIPLGLLDREDGRWLSDFLAAKAA